MVSRILSQRFRGNVNMVTFRETDVGNFIIYLGREPYSTTTKDLTQLPPNIPLSKVKLSRGRGGWSDPHPNALYKDQVQALADLGIHTLNELYAAREMDEVHRILRMNYCNEVITEFRNLCNALRDRAPAVLDSNYVPPTVIHFPAFSIQATNLPDEYWVDLDSSEQKEIRESIKSYLADNINDIMKETIKRVHQKKVERLQQQLEEAQAALNNL